MDFPKPAQLADSGVVGGPSLPRIESVWAFLCREKDGTEGVCAFMHPTLGWCAMVAADENRLAYLREYAQIIAKLTGNEIVLARFHGRQDQEVISP